ncbi:MAG TPA: hypothetical protein VIJ14_03535, partial [Rhabdochlamydiaceae bacterium]
MTNYLSSAMLSAGASCFGAIIDIEKDMSQAEINTLIASETMMSVQPLLMTALHNSYEAQAQDQLISGEIAGASAIAAGGVQLGLVGYGAYAADAASNAELEEPNLVKATVVPDETPTASMEGENTSDIEMEDFANKPAVSDSDGNTENTAAQEKTTAKETQQKTEETQEDKDAKAQREKNAKAQYKIIANKYSNFVQIFGPAINGVGTAAKSPFDAFATQNAGTAQAVNSVISGNQTAQSSNASLVQTYKDAFTNASQILAGIV